MRPSTYSTVIPFCKSCKFWCRPTDIAEDPAICARNCGPVQLALESLPPDQFEGWLAANSVSDEGTCREFEAR